MSLKKYYESNFGLFHRVYVGWYGWPRVVRSRLSDCKYLIKQWKTNLHKSSERSVDWLRRLEEKVSNNDSELKKLNDESIELKIEIKKLIEENSEMKKELFK